MSIVVSGQLDLSHNGQTVASIQPRSGGEISYSITGGHYVGVDQSWDGWDHHRWDVKFRRAGKTLTIAYRMGVGLHGAPDAVEVLECAFRDSEYAEFDSFESFALDMGYDLDDPDAARKAQRIYNACERMGARLDRFFGSRRSEWHGAIVRTSEEGGL